MQNAPEFQGLNIDSLTVVLVVVAFLVIWRLRSVLGRRSSEDDARIERIRSMQRQQASERRASDNVITLPQRDREDAPVQTSSASTSGLEARARITTFADGDTAMAHGLLKILEQDPTFDPAQFVDGAKKAYEMIVTAFADGNRKVLKDLLSRDVYEGFVAPIDQREARGERVQQKFVSLDKAEVIEAEVDKGHANVTVRFVSELISETQDASGKVVAGDPLSIKEVTDIWTFSRDVSTARARANLNWRLIATQSPG